MSNLLSKFVAPLRMRAGRLRKRLDILTMRRRFTLDGAQIEAALCEVMCGKPRILMMHSSLSACGYVSGGAGTVIRAVAQSSQTLVMPTHTYCYPPARGGDAPVFDPRATRSRVGHITEFFRQQPETLRSVHPTHSLAARGPLAGEIVRDHEICATPCGKGTPYDRLVQMDAAALMFGVTMHSYTLFHTAEDAAGAPYAYEAVPCRIRFLNSAGTVSCLQSLKQSQDERTFRRMDRPLEEAGLLRRHRLGRGELQFIPSTAAVHTFLLERFAEDPYYLAVTKRRK